MFSDCTDSFIMNGTCMMRSTSDMLQIFSLKLANVPVGVWPGRVVWIHSSGG
jgi:hypothetical protein